MENIISKCLRHAGRNFLHWTRNAYSLNLCSMLPAEHVCLFSWFCLALVKCNHDSTSLVTLMVVNMLKVGELIRVCAQTTGLVVLVCCGFAPVQWRVLFDFTGSGWDEISYGPKSLRIDGVAYPATSCVLTIQLKLWLIQPNEVLL